MPMRHESTGRTVECRECGGTGRVNTTWHIGRCQHCYGIGKVVVVDKRLEEARKRHAEQGGFLYRLDDGNYEVTDVHPSDWRSFPTTRDAIDYAFRLFEAGFDETRMQ